MFIFVLFILINFLTVNSLQLVVNTWPFTNATNAAWTELTRGKGTAIDAVVTGCSECETQQCDGTVGYGGDPDENGETTLDAMIMDGRTMDVGAVGCLRKIKSAIAVAKAVMDYTDHSLLAGELATQFAVEMGFKEEDLHTNRSIDLWKQWKHNNCQPNHRMNVLPDPTQSCGPYTPKNSNIEEERNRFRASFKGRLNNFNSKLWSEQISVRNYRDHDTIGMVAIDSNGNIAAGTSTNGLNHKVPGRVGDSPVAGAGSYAKNGVGAAAATGDGDVIMRFLPSFQAVNLMELMQLDPTEAARKSVAPMIKYFPKSHAALIVIHHTGTYGKFHLLVRNILWCQYL